MYFYTHTKKHTAKKKIRKYIYIDRSIGNYQRPKYVYLIWSISITFQRSSDNHIKTIRPQPAKKYQTQTTTTRINPKKKTVEKEKRAKNERCLGKLK